MSGPFSRKWLHPQAVPRGFLRMYMLELISRGPESGYSVMEKIDETTDGAWKPGPGTIYPLLRSLVSEGLIKASGSEKTASRKAYGLTPKGTRELAETRTFMAAAGRKERAMGRLFADLLPGKVFAPMIVNRMREGSVVLRRKIDEMPKADQEMLLKELHLILEGYLEWVDSQLGATKD